MSQWKRGNPIPKKYRNKMYAWEGGGYDGCFWEMNQGVVTDEGHWDPFHSTGRDGLDQDEWYRGKLRDLKERYGFEVGRYGVGEDVDAWYSCKKYRAHEEAMKKFYGEKPYDSPDYWDDSKPSGEKIVDRFHEQVEKYTAELLTEDTRRYREYCAARSEVRKQHHELLDEMFMDQVKAQAERDPEIPSYRYYGPARDRWEVYPLDNDRIKKSCERFCREYKATVGVMCGVLDALAERGYEVWCTCSDCGEQFQLSDYEKFSHLVDQNAYHGDNGIGYIFTRVQCEECHRETECPKCFEPNLPTQKDLEGGHAYDHWTFAERFIGIWIDVCDCCAYNFFAKDEYKHWSDDVGELEATIGKGKEQLKKYIETMKEQGTPEEELKRLESENFATLSKNWMALFNGLRDKMQKDVEEHFSDDCMDWANNRIDKPEELKDYV